MLRKNRSGATALLLASLCVSTTAQAQRTLGLDISAWQQDISQTTWNNIRNVENRQFVFIRSSRGGTTGFYDQRYPDNSDGRNTLSQRYDDPYFVQNVNRATAAGIYTGSYHFSRPDIVESTLNSGGIRNSGTDEADHYIQMAGAWMRPGYLVPIHDLEAGDGIRTDDELAQFCIDFSNRIYTRMGIRPGIYINGNYTANILQTASASLRDQIARPAANRPSVVAPCYPVLWVARWPNQTDPNSIDVQNTNPKDTYAGFYGPWDDYGDPNPWAFWQYASTGRLQSFNNGANNLDFDATRGDVEFLKDQLVPAVWMNDSSGDWSALANWNSGQTAIAPVTGPGQVTPIGTQTLPTPRLPGAAGTGVTAGRNDTVILERPSASITVTVSSGTHNVRKLYVREGLNITGGSLTVNYDPNYPGNPSFPNAARSGPISAQFSAAVNLSGGSLSVHTLQVDASRVFTLSGGTLTFKTTTLNSGARLLVSGAVAMNSLSGAATVSGGSVDLNGALRTLTIGDGVDENDVSINAPMIFGGLVKSGAGTLRLGGANTYAGGTTILEGRLVVNSSVGSGAVAVNGGVLSGTGTIAGVVSVASGGTLAAGGASSMGTLTLNSAPILEGTTSIKIDRAVISDRIALSAGALNYGGRLLVSNRGAALTAGDSFVVFSASSYGGEFAQVDLPALGSGLVWDFGMLNVNGTIRVAAGSPTARFEAGPVFDGETVRLRFVGQPGWTYFVERSTDLVSWETISTVRPPSSGVVEFVDAQPPQPAVFYRVSWVE